LSNELREIVEVLEAKGPKPVVLMIAVEVFAR
jgi:hypothetical protein